MKGKGREQLLEHREGHCIDWASWQELWPFRRMQTTSGYKAKKDLGTKYLDLWLHFPLPFDLYFCVPLWVKPSSSQRNKEPINAVFVLSLMCPRMRHRRQRMDLEDQKNGIQQNPYSVPFTEYHMPSFIFRANLNKMVILIFANKENEVQKVWMTYPRACN